MTCAKINAELIISVCPLPTGSCTWKHRIDGKCMYKKEYAQNPPSAVEIAQLVGCNPPSSIKVEEITIAIREKYKQELIHETNLDLE